MPDGGRSASPQLAADTGDHATGRSAARFAPPWEIPRGGANRRSVDRFIPRLWGNIGPAWSPSMSIPAHPHARGEHPHPWPRVGSSIGSSPHPWGIPQSVGIAALEQRFIPTPRGEHARVKEAASDAGGSSPHPWGTQVHAVRPFDDRRFIPTPVGNTCLVPGWSLASTVHPHTRGEHDLAPIMASNSSGSSPHPWGTLRPSLLRRFVPRFIPTPVGNT